MHTDTREEKLTQALKTVFQFNDFRPGQLDSLLALMNHGRLLCIQPTGYGKSLLYQLPACILEGITIVISPLLALIRDQVSQLNKRFNLAAASLNTDQSFHENQQIMQQALLGKMKILFIAPEQLDSISRLQFLLKLPIQLLVVDEAHCISTWGHDFRPSYRQIIKLTRELVQKNPDIKLLALTATANKKTEWDIKNQLSIDNKKMIIQRESMNRPNIRLSVIRVNGTAYKLFALKQVLDSLQGRGLIYCSTRENTEIVADYLQDEGINAAAYHAGMDIQTKKKIQSGFIQDEYSVVASTNALGMGIDKQNLRFIIHFDFPGSITAYYQEVGRAGRDGLPADGILLYDPKDSKVQYYFIESAQPQAKEFDLVLSLFENNQTTLNLIDLKRLSALHPTKLNVILAELIEQEYLKKILHQGQQYYQFTSKQSKPKLDRYKKQLEQRLLELKAMQAYAEHSKKCLMAELRAALGDKKPSRCDQCSHCKHLSFVITNDASQFTLVSHWIKRRTYRTAPALT